MIPYYHEANQMDSDRVIARRVGDKCPWRLLLSFDRSADIFIDMHDDNNNHKIPGAVALLDNGIPA